MGGISKRVIQYIFEIIFEMGRMHSKGKGISSTAIPYKRSAASWLKPNSQKNSYDIAQAISNAIQKMAKKGMTPSEIGVALRDSQGIPQVKTISGSKILRILKHAG